MPESYGVEIDLYSRTAERKRLLCDFESAIKVEKRDYLLSYAGYEWNNSMKVAEKFIINIKCY